MSGCLDLNAICHPDGVPPCCKGSCTASSSFISPVCTLDQCLEDGSPCNENESTVTALCCSAHCHHTPGSFIGSCAPANSSIITEKEWGHVAPELVYASVGLLIVVAAVGALGVVACLRSRQGRRKTLLMSSAEVHKFLYGSSTETATGIKPTYVEMKHAIDSKRYNPRLEVDDKDFSITHSATLGSGEFSVVMLAHLRGSPVAAKTVRPGVQEPEYLKALLRELKTLVEIGSHDNIVSLLGAYTARLRHGVCYLFMELCEEGSLERYLNQHRATAITTTFAYTTNESLALLQRLTPWSMEIAAGMAHLASLRIVHGDLATRNVLLNDRLVAKVADFGLSRQLYAYAKSVTQSDDVPLPWQHMAPESLAHLTFSTHSDVWAFGVTLWQIFSLGEEPYAGSTFSLAAVLQRLRMGARLDRPPHATDRLHTLMQQCWATEPDERPPFEEILLFLQNELNACFVIA